MQEILNKIKDIVDFINEYKKFIIPGVIVLVLVITVLVFREAPLTVDGMIKKADTFAQKGQVALALEEYNKIVRLYPKNYDVHIRLAEVYNTVNEPDKAKIEYLRAIRLGYKQRYEANIALANIYVQEQHYNIAEQLIKLLGNNSRNEARQKVGDFYLSWADTLKDGDRLEAIRKYKEAAKFYDGVNKKLEKTVNKEIIRLYSDISDTLLESDEVDNAVEILKIAIEYKDNATSHYKLAKIYENHFTLDEAIAEYEEAFNLNPDIGNKSSYKKLLLKKAQIMAEHGDKIHSDFYRMKARKIDSKVEVPTFTDKSLIFSLVSSRVNEDIDRDVLIPGIIFKLTNISKYPLYDVRAKVVFLEGGKAFSTKIVTIASDIAPLKGDSATKDISVYSAEPVKYVFDEHDLMIQVFLSQASGEKEWKLFKNVKIPRDRKPFILTK